MEGQRANSREDATVLCTSTQEAMGYSTMSYSMGVMTQSQARAPPLMDIDGLQAVTSAVWHGLCSSLRMTPLAGTSR